MPDPTPEQARELAAKVAQLAQALGVDVDAEDVRKRFGAYTLGRHFDCLKVLAETLRKERGAGKKHKPRESRKPPKARTVPPGLRPHEWRPFKPLFSPPPRTRRQRSSDDY